MNGAYFTAELQTLYVLIGEDEKYVFPTIEFDSPHPTLTSLVITSETVGDSLYTPYNQLYNFFELQGLSKRAEWETLINANPGPHRFTITISDSGGGTTVRYLDTYAAPYIVVRGTNSLDPLVFYRGIEPDDATKYDIKGS